MIFTSYPLVVLLSYTQTNLSISNIREIFHGLGPPRIRKYMDDNTDDSAGQGTP